MINRAGLHPIRRPGLNYSQSHFVRCDNPDGTSSMSSAYTLNDPYRPTSRAAPSIFGQHRGATAARAAGRAVGEGRRPSASGRCPVDARRLPNSPRCGPNCPTTARPGILGESDLPQLIAGSINGGKRFRPVMSYLGWLAAGGEERGRGQGDVVQIGAALEMLQLFVLVHDDVMDESASRRGRPTVHCPGQGHARGAAAASAARSASARASPCWSAIWRTPRPATWSPLCRRQCAGSGGSWLPNWSPANAATWSEVPPGKGISHSPGPSPG